MKIIFISLFILLTMSGCISDKELTYSKPINQWVSQINNNIQNSELDAAYTDYLSLSTEHREYNENSDLLLKIIFAHIKENEDVQSNQLLDEYLLKYCSASNIDYINFIKIKSKYKSIELSNRNQVKITKTITLCNSFLNTYKDSKYLPEVVDFKKSLVDKNNQINSHIMEYYKRKHQDIGESLYKNKIEDNFIDHNDNSFIRNLFE